MIEVESIFYDRGLTMDGKGNRVMLKKDGETYIEMVFSRDKVELKGMTAGKVNHSKTVNFSGICAITIDNGEPPLPGIVLY